MESYPYTPSYPDSGHSSPRSKEIDFENSSPWEDPLNSQTPSAYKVKFMCSYGGKIHPRPHDNQLSYVGGETKILVVDRNIKFSALLAKLSGAFDNDNVSFKYQLPGEDLDALISVTNDEDLENMLQEYDRLYKVSPKPARLRLFLFGASPCQPPPTGNSSVGSLGTRSFGSDEGLTTKSQKERFVEALNSVPPPPLAAVAPPPIPAGNMDFLFGLEKEMASPPPPQLLQPPVVVGRARDSQQAADPPVHEPDVPVPVLDDKLAGSDPIQKHIQDLQRLRIEAQQQAMYQKKSNDNVTGGFPISAAAGDYYVPKLPENVPQMTVPATVSMQQGAGYWTEKHVPGGVFQGSEPLYMIQTPSGAYGHHPQMMRPISAPSGQGYYTLQSMPLDAYSNQQPAYNIVPSMPANVKPVAAPPPPSQLPAKMTAYSEGFGVIRPNSIGVGTMEGGGYAQMAYDNRIGRQVYYNAHGGGVMAGPPPSQQQQQAAAQYHPAPNQEAVKVVGKATQAS